MKIEFNDTADVQLTHPVTGADLYDEDGNAMTVTIYGAQSPQYRKIKNSQLNKRIGGKKGPATMTAEQIEQDACNMLASLTVGFNNVVINDVVFDAENAKSLYADFPWLKDQVDEAIMDGERFLVSSSS